MRLARKSFRSSSTSAIADSVEVSHGKMRNPKASEGNSRRSLSSFDGLRRMSSSSSLNSLTNSFRREKKSGLRSQSTETVETVLMNLNEEESISEEDEKSIILEAENEQQRISLEDMRNELHKSMSFLKRKRRRNAATIPIAPVACERTIRSLNNDQSLSTVSETHDVTESEHLETRNDSNGTNMQVDNPFVSIDRASIRLDGIEVYAVVSALTIATSVALFDIHGVHHETWTDKFNKGEYFELMTILCILCSSVSTILSGVYATLIFSLMTMYGRTAVGVGNDEGFLEFFQATGLLRYRGFKSFQAALYSFLVQIILTMLTQVPMNLRFVFGAGLSYISYLIYADTENCIALASRLLFK